MTHSDISFLLKLKEMGDVTQKELADSRNMNNTTVRRGLEILEKKGICKKNR